MPPMAEWPQIMEGNIVHLLMVGNMLFGCYAGNLQRSAVYCYRATSSDLTG